MEWQTPGGMFQRYTVRKKGEDHKWDRDAVPQAYIDRNGELTIPISGVGGKTVQSFLQKNAPTLKYFWDWTKQDANTNGQDLPWPTKDGKVNERYIAVQSYLQGGPQIIVEPHGPYDYRNSSDIVLAGFKHQEPVYLRTTGLANIKTSGLTRITSDGNSIEKGGSLIGVLKKKRDPIVNSYNNNLSSQAGSEYRSFKKIEDVSAGGEYQINISMEFNQFIETSDTYDVLTEEENNVTVHADAHAGYEKGGFNTEVNLAYDEYWGSKKTVTASHATREQLSKKITDNTSIVLKPKASNNGIKVDIEGEEIIFETGVTLLVEYVLSSGTYTDDLTYPHQLDGTYGSLNLGTVTGTNGGLVLGSWASTSNAKKAVDWVKGNDGDGRIGHLVKYANDYQWWNALYPEGNEDLKGLIEMGSDEDGTYMKVNGATTTTTVVGTNVEIKTTQVYEPDDDSLQANTARQVNSLGRNQRPSRKTIETKSLTHRYGKLRQLSKSKLRLFEEAKILDLDKEIDKIANRIGISGRDKNSIPGFSLPADLADQALILRLPKRFNNIDLSSSDSPSLVFSNGSSGVVRLGQAADTIISARNSSSSIHTGEGADFILSKGKSDFLNPGKGKNEIHLLGGYTSVQLDGGTDKILLGEDGKISINNFRPGISRIGSSVRQGLKQRLASFDKDNFQLTASKRSSDGIFGLKDKLTGESRGSLQIDSSLGKTNKAFWVNYGLRFRNGKLLERLSKGPDLSGYYSMEQLGSELVFQVDRSLDELKDLAKTKFMKRGFYQGNESYTEQFNTVTGARLKGKIKDFLENLHGEIFSSLGGKKSLKNLLDDGASINFDDYHEPGKFLGELISTGYAKNVGLENITPIFSSVMDGLEEKFNSVEFS